MFHKCFNSLVASWYFSSPLLSSTFILWSTEKQNSTNKQVLFFLLNKTESVSYSRDLMINLCVKIAEDFVCLIFQYRFLSVCMYHLPVSLNFRHLHSSWWITFSTQSSLSVHFLWTNFLNSLMHLITLPLSFSFCLSLSFSLFPSLPLRLSLSFSFSIPFRLSLSLFFISLSLSSSLCFYHPSLSLFLGQNTEESSGDLRRLHLSQNLVKPIRWHWCEKLFRELNNSYQENIL